MTEETPAPFVDRRTTCACGDYTLPENVHAVPDEADDRFLHSPALCFVMTDEEYAR